MITVEVAERLVAAAARAPSADNMQAWAFATAGDAVEVSLDPSRVLPTDVHRMFAWVGLGAAVENLIVAANHEGFAATVEDHLLPGADRTGAMPADEAAGHVTVRLTPAGADNRLAAWIECRETNRGRYVAEPLAQGVMDELARTTMGLDARVHWAAGTADLSLLATMDAHSTYIRLEHAPLHDELFDVLRFSRRELERTRYGLDFASLGIPTALVSLARLLRYRPVMQLVSRVGIGRLVARQLAAKLRAAQAVCLVTATAPGAWGYVAAGRAMERLWLEATSRGLAVQPHGVLPQYLTKLDDEPGGFGPRYATVMARHRQPFETLFPMEVGERPAIVLRIGRPKQRPARRSLRLPTSRLMRVNQEV